MAETNQNKSNYTNLAETYLYGKVSDRLNFYKYYKNDENSIDDPIFTGFTFDIDMLHSPLFFTGTGDMYTSPETLRDISGSGSSSLAETIENRLTQTYKLAVMGSTNTYEMNTISVKDILDSMESHMVGYGLMDKFYIDNIIYGATDYIYMVDKVSIGKYDDTIGVSDVGNGTPSTSQYTEYTNLVENTATEVNSQNTEIEPTTEAGQKIDDIDCPVETSTNDPDSNIYAVDKKIDELSDKLDSSSSINEEHENNKNTVQQLKEEYDKKLSDSGYDGLKMQLNLLKESIDSQKDDVSKKLNEYQSITTTSLSKVRNNLLNTEAKETIGKTYDEFNDFYNNIATTYNLINVSISKGSNFESDINSMTTEEKSAGLLELYTKAWEIIYTKITGKERTDGVQKSLNAYQDRITSIEKELYGTDASGNILTQYNPDPNSLYGKLKEAQVNLQNDQYSQIESQVYALNEAKENYKDALEYEEYNSTKNTITSNFPTIDASSNLSGSAYAEEIEKSRTTRQTYEVPQTVYDMLGFISGMTKLTQKYPYVMQSISGLDEAYKKYFVIKDPYMGSGDDKITISCFESLDLRVSSMFNKYLNAVYDRQYRRERVPVNLRRFNCSVFVHDIRNFRHSLSKYFAEKKDGDDTKSKIVEIALNSVSAIEFKFIDCEIVPEETGSIFDSVSNDSQGDMRKTNFTFTYGNCVINFLPFEDLKKYYGSGLNSITTTSNDESKLYASKDLGETYDGDYTELHKTYQGNFDSTTSGDFRRWFDKSSLGNVNNNDYRDYVRHDSSVAVDDYYKSTIVNNFALNSLTNKNKELTQLDDALRKIVVGISASTGLPVKGVTDALDISFIDPIITRRDEDTPIIKKLGNVYNSKVVDEKTMEYIGTVIGDNENIEKTSQEIGNVYNTTNEDIKTSESIGTVFGEDKTGRVVTKLGDVFSNDQVGTDVSDIGKVFDNTATGTKVTELGKAFEDDSTSKDVSDIGKVFDNTVTGTKVTELGKAFEDDSTSKDVSDIGKVFDNTATGTDVTELGKAFKDDSTSKDVSNIGKVFDNTTTGTKVTELGKAFEDNSSKKNTSNLGKVFDNTATGTNVTDLGKAFEDDSSSNNITNLGKVFNEKDTGKEVNDLGEVFDNNETGTIVRNLGKIDTTKGW